MRFRQQSNIKSLLLVSIFLICLLALSIPCFGQSENLNILDNWVEWSNAENMLNLHINKQAFHYLNIREKEIELAIQVNGKIKDKIIVAADSSEDQIKQKALSCEKVLAAMAGKEPKKVIVIKSRLVNIVI